MGSLKRVARIALLLICGTLLCIGDNAQAIILHQGSSEPVDRPDNAVMGRWGTYNGSCVAISRQYIVSTKHQPGSSATPIIIEGRTYNISQLWEHPTEDLRLAKLRHANLASYVDLYTTPNETGKEIVIGGYGDGWDALLQTEGITYGYNWDNSANINLRWCSNKIDLTYTDALQADFDDPNVASATTYEGTIADHDSGGGWFIKSGSVWKLAGLSYGVELGHAGESWFRDSVDPDILDPDNFSAWRISNFDTWFTNIINTQQDCGFHEADLNDDCVVDIGDFGEFSQWWLRSDCSLGNNYCQGSDFEPVNGSVDLVDFTRFISKWLDIYP